MINGYRNGIREQQGAYQISQRQGAGSCTFQRSRKWDRLAPSLGDWYCLNRQDPLWSPPLWPSSRFRLRWYSQSYISGEQPVFVRLDRASWESSRRLTQFKKKRKIDASRDSLHFFFILVSKGQGNCIFLLRSICADCWRLDCIFCWLDFNDDAHCFNQSLDDVPLSASRVDVSNNQPKIWRTYNSNLALHLVSADCTSNLKQGWEMAGSFLVFWRKASFTVYLVNPELIGVCVATTLLMTQYLRAARLHPDGSRMRLRIAGAVLLSLTNRKDFLGFWCPLFVEREREREKKNTCFSEILQEWSWCDGTAIYETVDWPTEFRRNDFPAIAAVSLHNRLPAPWMPFLIVARPSLFAQTCGTGQPANMLRWKQEKGRRKTICGCMSMFPSVSSFPRGFVRAKNARRGTPITTD